MLSRASFLFCLVLILSVVVLAAGSFAHALFTEGDGVVMLTPENFKDEVLKHKGPVLVEFFAPWCGHCVRGKPEYIETAKALDGVVKVAAMDADKYGAFAGKYGVQGFPTIKWFGANKRQPTDYDGGRKKADFVAEALKQVEAVAQSRLK